MKKNSFGIRFSSIKNGCVWRKAKMKGNQFGIQMRFGNND